MNREQIKQFYDSLLIANPELAGEDTLDWKIREALESIILAVSPDAKVFPFDVLRHEPDEWASIFTQNDVLEGWVIRRADLDGEWRRQTSYQLSYGYNLWGFYGFNPKSRVDNSDRKFQRITDLIVLLTSQLPKLGIEHGVDEHKFLTFKNMTTLRGGKKQMHWNPGRIEVVPCEMQPGIHPC